MPIVLVPEPVSAVVEALIAVAAQSPYPVVPFRPAVLVPEPVSAVDELILTVVTSPYPVVQSQQLAESLAPVLGDLRMGVAAILKYKTAISQRQAVDGARASEAVLEQAQEILPYPAVLSRHMQEITLLAYTPEALESARVGQIQLILIMAVTLKYSAVR